ncbi:unnamed protein product [Moneuplotes crassus]|uniref:Uncharacterized protein n=1 Tax=Euplotes crassus TaxID=5936 RepID=A0AAD1UC52_EUPCR|nr:unnamed protein product [Moneuplotes crassus]
MGLDLSNTLQVNKQRYSSVITRVENSPKKMANRTGIRYGKGQKMSKILKINTKLKSIYREQLNSPNMNYFRNSSVPKRSKNIADSMNFPQNISQLSLDSEQSGMQSIKKNNEFTEKLQNSVHIPSSQVSKNGSELNEKIKSFFPQLDCAKNSSLVSFLSKQPLGDKIETFNHRKHSLVLNTELESLFNIKEGPLKNNVSQTKKARNKKSSLGLFFDLESKKPIYDMTVYSKVLNQQLTKMDNQFLQDKYKAYLETKKKRMKQVRNSTRF